MSITSGFYNSRNHDRQYTNMQIGSIFDGIITDGVYSTIYKQFIVKPSTGMELIVQPGRCWFNHTWLLNDADYPVTLNPAEAVLPRIDAIVIEINAETSVRAGSVKVVKGVPSKNTEKPKLTNTDRINQYPLAYVKVLPESTSVTSENITNAVGTSECPFVTGVLSQVTTDELIAQWEARFEILFAEMQKQIDQLIQGSVPDGSVSSIYSVIIPHTEWQEVDGHYEKEISVIGLRDTDHPILDLDLSGVPSFDAKTEISDSWSIFQAIPGKDVLRVCFTYIPDVDIPVKMQCVRK